MSSSRLQDFALRLRWASADARGAAQTLKGGLFAALVGAVSGFFASRTKDPSVLLVAGAATAGFLSPLVVAFFWRFLTFPRRRLEGQVEELEEGLEHLRARLSQLVEEKHGDPLQFLPIYNQLRMDVREATRLIGRAQETGELWGWMGAPQYRNWKRHREEIANNPFARRDALYGDLLEAFDHVERLATSTSVRFGRRRVRPSDDLDVALMALEKAEEKLSTSIDRLEALPEFPTLVQDAA